VWLSLLCSVAVQASAGGVLCGGATIANIIALAAARDEVLEAAGWDVDADGLVGAPPIKLFIGEESHGSVAKAFGVVGLGEHTPSPQS
jgi:glutamate/tyrosine decarboxylase-like PLP-dependent enzyme